MKAISRIRFIPFFWIGIAAAVVALSTMVGGCNSQQSSQTDNTQEVPEGYDSWEDYGKAQDLKQFDHETDKARYRQQLQRQRSSPMRR